MALILKIFPYASPEIVTAAVTISVFAYGKILRINAIIFKKC